MADGSAGTVASVNGVTRGIENMSDRAQAFFHDQPLGDGWIAWNLKDKARFNALIEPLTVRQEPMTPDGRPVARTRMIPTRQHSNLSDNVHGAITLSLIDLALFASCHQFGVLNVGPAVTLDLATQFIGAGRLGEPLDAVTELVRETGRLVFLRGMVMQGVDDRHIVATYSGTLRKASPQR